MIPRLTCLALCMSGLWSPAYAQTPPFPTDSIDRFVQTEMKRQHTPGMSVAVLVGDSVMLARGYGFANLELGVPRVGQHDLSVGVGRKTVHFGARPDAGGAGPSRTRAIQSFDICPRENSAGRGSPSGICSPTPPESPSTPTASSICDVTIREDQLVRIAAGLPLMFAPGARWSYSNTGYLLLGVLVHRVTGTFYGDLLRDSIFTPLGMRSARVISEEDIVSNRAAGYRLVHGVVKNQEWVSPALNTTADGSLYLSLRDYERWAVALNHRERPSARVLEMAWTPVPLAGGGDLSLRRRMVSDPSARPPADRPYRRVAGFRTSIQRYPEFDMTVIVLANLETRHFGAHFRGDRGHRTAGAGGTADARTRPESRLACGTVLGAC